MNKRIAQNAAALMTAQIASYVLPLATFPYLVRVLGQNGFGRYSMAIAFAGYMQFVIEYGFGLTATSRLARIRNDDVEVSKLFWSVGVCKLLLFAVGFAFLQGVSFLLTDNSEIRWLNAFACLSAAGSAFFPTWLFQGFERMRTMSLLSVSIRVMGAAGIFLLISSIADLVRFMAFSAVLTWIGAGVGHWFVLRKSRIVWVGAKYLEIIPTLKSGGTVFASQIGALIISNTCILILGWSRGEAAAGAYSIAEKLVRAAISLTAPISTSLFPQAARLLQANVEEGLQFLRKYLKLTLPVVGFGALVLFLFASSFVRIVSGKEIAEAALCLRIMAFVPLSIVLDNFYGTQLLLNLGHSKLFLSGTLLGALSGLALQSVLIPMFGAPGAAAAFALSEFIVLVIFVLGARRVGKYLMPRFGI